MTQIENSIKNLFLIVFHVFLFDLICEKREREEKNTILLIYVYVVVLFCYLSTDNIYTILANTI